MYTISHIISMPYELSLLL